MKVISVELLKEFIEQFTDESIHHPKDEGIHIIMEGIKEHLLDFIDANSVEIPEQKEIIKIIQICQEVINCSNCSHNMTQHFAVSLHKIVKICDEQLTNKGEIKGE